MAAVSLGEGRMEKKMFLPVKIYRITTKVELAVFCSFASAREGESSKAVK